MCIHILFFRWIISKCVFNVLSFVLRPKKSNIHLLSELFKKHKEFLTIIYIFILLKYIQQRKPIIAIHQRPVHDVKVIHTNFVFCIETRVDISGSLFDNVCIGKLTDYRVCKTNCGKLSLSFAVLSHKHIHTNKIFTINTLFSTTKLWRIDN